MKGLACGRCYTVRTLPHNDGVWASCDCGNVSGRWVDGSRGVAEYQAHDREAAFGVGFNNRFLLAALQGETQMHEDARRLHDLATDALGYVFDKSRAGCWVVVFKPGATSDTSWAEEQS